MHTGGAWDGQAPGTRTHPSWAASPRLIAVHGSAAGYSGAPFPPLPSSEAVVSPRDSPGALGPQRPAGGPARARRGMNNWLTEAAEWNYRCGWVPRRPHLSRGCRCRHPGEHGSPPKTPLTARQSALPSGWEHICILHFRFTGVPRTGKINEHNLAGGVWKRPPPPPQGRAEGPICWGWSCPLGWREPQLPNWGAQRATRCSSILCLFSFV